MTVPIAILAALAIFCAAPGTIGLSTLIASWLGSVELTPLVFAAGFWVLANLPEERSTR